MRFEAALVFNSFKKYSVFAFVPFLLQTAIAGETESDIDEIVVVAHKTEREIRNVAANVSVLSKTDIDQTLSLSAADVFRYSPGIDFEQAGPRFGDEGLSIRGIGGNRVAMLLDGVPLSDQFDVGNFSNATRDFLDAGLIQRIEVLHGPSSALYGSSAIGGVMSIRTLDPEDLLTDNDLGADLGVMWRQADRATRLAGAVAGQQGSISWLAGGSIYEGSEPLSAAINDNPDISDRQRDTALAKLYYDLNEAHRFSVLYIHQKSDVTSELNSFLGTGRFRFTTELKGDDQYTADLAGLSWEYRASDSWIDSAKWQLYSQSTDIKQNTLDVRAASRRPASIDRLFSFEQDIIGTELNLQKNWQSGRVEHQFGFGLEYRKKETVEFRDGVSTSLTTGVATNVLLGEVFPLRDFPISESSEWGLYLEDALTMGDWSVIAAVRVDQFRLSPVVDTMYQEDYPFADPVGLKETDVSPKLGVIFHPADSLDIYLQYAHGFRAPPYEDANISLEIPLFNFRAVPNPDLKSESSDSGELGIRWRGERLSADVAVFHTRYRDFIESKIRIGADPVSDRVLFQSQNIDRTTITGFEAGLTLTAPFGMERVSVDGRLYSARGKNKVSGEALNSVGPAEMTLGIDWLTESGNSQFRLQAVGANAWDRRDESADPLFKPAGYVAFDAFYSQRIFENTTLRLGVQNFTDRTYWRWNSIRGLEPDDPMLPYLAQAGRNVTLNVSYRWR